MSTYAVSPALTELAWLSGVQSFRAGLPRHAHAFTAPVSIQQFDRGWREDQEVSEDGSEWMADEFSQVRIEAARKAVRARWGKGVKA